VAAVVRRTVSDYRFGGLEVGSRRGYAASLSGVCACVRRSEQVDQAREGVRGVLHVLLDEHARRPLQRHEFAGVAQRVTRVADDEARASSYRP
jgi:hypothetical protein